MKAFGNKHPRDHAANNGRGCLGDIHLERRFHTGLVRLLRTVNYLEQALRHHTVVLTGGLHTLVDLRAVGFYEAFARDYISDL
jgi:hypothetical protein